jgi:hypothetical protein
MRPYLAVIKDSFREALATRVLWIMLILIGVLLAALAPFGYQDTLAISLQNSDIREPAGFVNKLLLNAENKEIPAGHIWSKLPRELRDEIEKLKPEGDRRERMRLFGRLRRELNGLITSPDFYDAQVWKDVKSNKEMRDLIESTSEPVSDASSKKAEDADKSTQIARRNRLALDAAFPDSISPAGAYAIQAVYMGYKLGDEVPVTKSQMQQVVSMILAELVSRLLGNLGVFIAILVTASIIPQMLDAGAIDLLLSKPVSRPLLFLSKFIGGCGFILMNATLMIVGLWLIVGLRFDIWSNGLLLTIPVFVFVFAVYYSVSTLAAVIWRNAVVSIVISILFWGACFTVGIAKTQADIIALNPRRTAAIIPTDESILITNKAGKGFEWNAAEESWHQVFEERLRGPAFALGYPFLGPIYDKQNERLIAVRVPQGRMRWMQASGKLMVAEASNDWRPKQSIPVPSSTKFVGLTKTGVPIIAGTTGIHEIEGDLSKEQKGIKFLGFGIGTGDGPKLVRVDEKQRNVWREPFTVDYDAESDQFAVVSGDQIAVLKRNKDGKYAVTKSAKREDSEPALIATNGRDVFVSERDGTLRRFAADSLKEGASTKPMGTNEPQSIDSTIHGDASLVSVVYHNRTFALLDSELTTTKTGTDVSIARFHGSEFFIADRFGRVTSYDLENDLKQNKRYEPESDFLEQIYQSVVTPLHSVFPKPGEMQNLVRWLMTQQETVAIDDESTELKSERVILDVWQPLWSNLAFLAVILGFTCIYISRRDF